MITIRDNYEDYIINTINDALKFNQNLEEGMSPISLTQIEISRGLYNRLKGNKSCLQTEDFTIDGVSYELIDNYDLGCYLQIRYV
jgi:hypothetical protein